MMCEVLTNAAPLPPTADLGGLEALVARAEGAALDAAHAALDAYTVQIHELVDAAEYALVNARRWLAEIPGDRRPGANLGEGYTETYLVEDAAREAARYAHEARHWLHCYAAAHRRLARGQPAFIWGAEPPALYAERMAIVAERDAMEAAQ